MAVEWLRSAYTSDWRLFNDSLNTSTRGRYYFREDDVPFYPGFHNLWSSTWLPNDASNDGSLGEDTSAARSWDNGIEPATVPGNTFTGLQSCIEAGDSLANALGTDRLQDGIPLPCFQILPTFDYWGVVGSWRSCSMQAFWITVIMWMYQDDVTSINQAFLLLLGNQAVVTFHPGTVLYPDILTVKTPTCYAVVADGTQNYQQFATQAFQQLRGPQSYGNFSTLPLWYDASSRALQFMNDDGLTDNNLPIMLAGHSYGGALISVTAGRLRLASPRRVISQITYGTPKIGDELMSNLSATISGINILNSGDYVPLLPPTREEILPIATVLHNNALYVWASWVPLAYRAEMDLNGVLTNNPETTLAYQVLLDMTNLVLAGQPLDPITPHRSGEYQRRILVRCPNPEWPVSASLWSLLTSAIPPPTEEVITTAGPGQFIVPAGCTSLTVELWGSGSPGVAVGGLFQAYGGGGGAYSRSVITVIPGTIYNYYVGISAGFHLATTRITWFNNSSSYRADFGGNSAGVNPEVPGTAAHSLGDVVFDGGWGGFDAGNFRGGGGSSAGTGAIGNPSTFGSHSNGAIGPPGAGNGGDGGQNSPLFTDGQPGTQPGGGGGGATSGNNAGAGANGKIRLSW